MIELSPYLVAIVLGWVIAQGLKYVFDALKARRIGNIRQLYASGNMPSAHSASVVALATVIGLLDGVDSGLFGLSVLFAAVVMYDAIMVRRSAGEQGLAIQQLIKLGKAKIVNPRSAKGHTPFEVLMGSLLGLLIGLAVVALI